MREGLASWSDEEFAAHASNLPMSYWTSFDTPSQIAHAELSRGFRQQEVPILIDLRPDVSKRITEMTVFSIDDAGLFSRIAGAVASTGVNIVGARIATCSDGSVLDVFILQTTENEAVGIPHCSSDCRKMSRQRSLAVFGQTDAQRTVATDAAACPPYAGAVTCDPANKIS